MKQFLERFANWRTKLWGRILAFVDPKTDDDLAAGLRKYLSEPGMPMEGRSS